MASNDADVQCPCNEEFACGGSITELEMRAVSVVCVHVCVCACVCVCMLAVCVIQVIKQFFLVICFSLLD